MSATTLRALGAHPQHLAAFEALARPELVAGRVTSQRGPELVVNLGDRNVLARASGVLTRAATAAHELPVVGDFVALKLGQGEGASRVEQVLPRTSLLSRRDVGAEGRVQAMAANVDVVLAVAALDADFSPRRIERVIALAREAQATPVVVLTKADLCADVASAVEAARVVARDAAVIVIGADDERGLDDLTRSLPTGSTGVLVGLSGAGKSTLTNRLLANEQMSVGAVRAFDGRGRHTTTHRELLSTPWGAFLVDGPGVRELGVVADQGVEDAFDDVRPLAAACRFSDCSHLREPGCAVRAAVERGALPQERVDAYQKLEREAAFARSQIDASEKRARKLRERAVSSAAWHATRRKRDER